MKAALEDKDFELKWPVDASLKDVKVKRTVRAKDLWKKLVQANWEGAEPGILFWDKFLGNSLSDGYADEGFKTISTNPCLSKDTRIITDKGNLTIEELLQRFNLGESFKVLSYDENNKRVEFRSMTRVFLTKKDAELIEILTTDGTKLKLTPDHLVYTENRGYVEAERLTFNDDVVSTTGFFESGIAKVIEKEAVPREDVYDLSVEGNHNFFANGLLVHNCAELPLSEYGSCILMLVNLFSFVENGKFNFSKFDEEVRLAMRLIDDMVDLEVEKVDKILAKIEADGEDEEIKSRELSLWKKIKETYRKGRRVGLGITALADCLAAQNVKYGSDESLKIVEEIFKNFNESVMKEQVVLAKERGTFPIWNWEKEKDVSYIKVLPQALQDGLKKYGRRNISVTTCSPAGSVSMLTRTSSGVEPIFMRKYVRRKKMTQGDKSRGVKANSVDADGIEWTSFEVTHPKLTDWLRANPGKTEKDSPYWGAQSNEIDIKQRIHLQAIMQRFIHHSISSTLNFPATATVQDVENAYVEAWKSGCKGITVYRDGCRDGVLVKDEKKVHIQLNQAPHRPEVLECDIHYSNINGNQWVFFVGLLDGMPYDVFGGRKTIIEIPKKYKKGWIKKNGKVKDKNGASRRSYDLYLGTLEDTEERMIIKDIASSFSADAGSYTRLISMAMRHGVPIKYICEQLMKDGAEVNMFSLERCIARIIKKYIRDGEKAGGACESCGDQLVYKDGCVICPSCGWSKCS